MCCVQSDWQRSSTKAEQQLKSKAETGDDLQYIALS